MVAGHPVMLQLCVVPVAAYSLAAAVRLLCFCSAFVQKLSRRTRSRFTRRRASVSGISFAAAWKASSRSAKCTSS